MILSNKTANIRPKKNLVPESDFRKSVDGLATPLISYGNNIYSISDEVFIKGTKSQRVQYTSSKNDGVAFANKGVRLSLNNRYYDNLKKGNTYALSFYGKGMEEYRSVSVYAGGVSVTYLTKENVGNGWTRFQYRITLSSTVEDRNIYIRPNNNQDYSFDCLINALQIEEGLTPTAYEAYEAGNTDSKQIYVSDDVPSIPLQAGASGYGTTTTVDNSVMYNGKPMNKVQITDATGSQAKYGGTKFSIETGKTYFLQTILFDPTNLYRYSAIYSDGITLKNDLYGGTSAVVTDFGNGYKLLQARFTATFTGTLSHGFIHYLNVAKDNKMWFGEVTVQEGTEFKYSLSSKKALLVPKKNLLPPLSQWEKRDGNAVIISDYEGTINPVSNYTGFRYNKLDIKRDVPHTISIEEITAGAVCFFAYRDATDVIRYTTLSKEGSMIKTFTVPNNAKEYWVEMHYQTLRGLAKFKNFMLEEGSVKTDFESQKLAPKKANLSVSKAPYRTFPFSFNRESVEMLDGVQYGINNPRIKDGGLLIEEGLTNTVSNSDKVSELRTVNGYYGQVTYNHGLPKGGKVQATDDKYTVQFELKKIGKDSRPFVSVVVGAQPPKDSWSWRLFDYDFHEGIEIEDLEDGWQRYTKTFTIKGTKGEYLQTFIKFICEVRDVDIDSLIRNVQIEEKDYATSYTTGFRKNEVAVTNVTFDRQAGSIETEFDFFDNASKSQYIFDTGQNRWILYKDAWDNTVNVYLDGVKAISLPKSVLPNGKIKARIEWSNPDVKLYINDSLVGTGTYLGSNYTTKDVYLGTRYTVVEFLNNIIYSFKVTDRNGNVISEI